MSADKVRKLLGNLHDDPENEKAWIALEEMAINGELAPLGDDLGERLEHQRKRFLAAGEVEAAVRMLDIEVEVATKRATKAALLRLRARLLEEEMLDDKAAVAAIDALLALGPDPEAGEIRDRLVSKKAKWKDIAAAFKRNAESDTTDPNLIASHLVSAAGIVLQYKPKGRDKEADAIFEAALAVDPGNLRAVQLFERVLRRRGNRWDDLAAHLERSADAVIDPHEKVSILFRAARTHAAHRNDIVAAERLYRQVLVLEPTNDDAVRFVVAILTDRERWDDLAAFYEALVRATPENAIDLGLLVQAGMINWRTRNDRARAAPYFQRIRAIAPDNALATSFFAEGAPAAAAPADDEVQFDTGDDEEIVMTVDDDDSAATTSDVGDSVGNDTVRPNDTVEMRAAGITVDDTPDPGATVQMRAAEPERPVEMRPRARTVLMVVPEADEPKADAPTAAEPTAAEPTPAEPPKAAEPTPAEPPKAEEPTPAEPPKAEEPVAVAEPAKVETPPVAESRVTDATPDPNATIEAPAASATTTVPDAPVAEERPVMIPPPRTSQTIEAVPSTRVSQVVETIPATRTSQTMEALGGRGLRPSATPADRVKQTIDAAVAAEAQGQIDRAIDGWKFVLRQEPTHADARNNLVRLYSAAGRWNNLVELYRQELDALGGVRPGTDLSVNRERKLEILREMVAIYRDRLALEPMVVQTYNSILLLDPGDRPSLVALAASYEKLGRYTDVIKVLEQQVEHGRDVPEKVTILRRIAALWIERFNNVNNATRPLEQIVALDARDSDAIAQLKELYNRRRAWRPLFDVSRREADLLDGSARRDALVELAKLAAEKLSSNQEAIALWRESLALDPTTPGALDALEKLTEREKDYQGLAEVLEKRVEESTDPEQKVNVLMKLGAVYGERLNDTARSVDTWRRVLATKPGHSKAVRVLRDAYTQAAQWDDLEDLYTRANDFEGLTEVLGSSADRAPDGETRVALSFRVARVYEEKLHQPERAFRSYERVLSVEPKNERAATALVPIYLKDEKWPRLAQLYEVLLDAVPQGDRATSLSYLQKLRELASTRLGDRPAAFRWALRAYQIEPGDPDLEAALERAAADAGAWRELVDTLDARAAYVTDPDESARLRDKSATIEADRLNQLDAAISRYQKALALTPDDAHVIETLDRLLRRATRWADLRGLYDHRLQRAGDDAARRALLLEVARLEENELRDADAASARFRAVLTADPADIEALESLSRLAEAAGRWEEFSQLLATRRDLAHGSARAALAFRLGQLRLGELKDTEGAIASFREVLDLVPHHPEALAALETLLRDDAWRVTAARLLEPEFEAIGEHRKLAWVLQILFDATPDLDARRALGLRLARVYSERLSDARSGFDLLRSMAEAEPGSDEVVDALTDLSAQGGWTQELTGLLGDIVSRPELAPAVRVGLARRAASVHEDRHGDAVAAERFHRIVLDAGELDLHAFTALKGLYQSQDRWDDLRALYALWVERTEDVPSRIELLLEEAQLLEEILDRPADAVDVYTRILALDATNRTASRALDRLLVRLGRWSELKTLLTRTLEQVETSAPDEALELLFRRGEVHELRLADPDGALADYTTVVEREPSHAGARLGLERLLDVPALRQRAAAVLEPLYERDGDTSAGNLARMLMVRLEFTADASARAELLRRVAELRELVLNDIPGAFQAITDAVLAEPTSAELRDELLRLAVIANGDARAADTLERAAQVPEAASAKVAILRDLAALYDERLIEPTKAERTFRRLLDAAPEDGEVATHAATALERLYRGLQNPRGLVDALELRAKWEGDPQVRLSLHAQAGEILEDELNDLPGAIAQQRQRLEIDPGDRTALRALTRLYERTEAWTSLVDTLRQDAELADAADEQKALLVRAGAVLEGRVADISAAIALYREVLERFGADRSIHAALARLYEVSDQWPELLDVLEQDLTIADTTEDRLALVVRAAELRRTRTKDLSRAVDGYREALEIDPSQPTARAALWGLLDAPEEGVSLAAARALDPVLQGEQSWEKLVQVLDRIASKTDDADERRQTLARAAEVCEAGLDAPGRAFDYAARNLRESLGEPDVAERITHIELLAKASNRAADLVAVLKEVGPQLLDADLQRDVFMKVADLARTALDDRATARVWYERALDQQPDYLPALDALESLHEGGSAWTDLAAVLRRKTDLAVDDTTRKGLFRKLAGTLEDKLSDRPAAAQAHEAILGIGFDRDSAHALERIYAQESRWDDLAGLLENQLAQPDADEVDLHHRLGTVSMEHLDNPDRALDHFREVLERVSDHEPTVKALETLGAREGYAARTAAMLEPIYRGRMDMPKLIGALEARIAAESDITARKELLTRLGTIYEENLGDLDKALETHARVFREEISDRETWDVLARLAKALDRHDRLAEIYAGALDEVSADDDVTAALAFNTGRLFDDRVKDGKRARKYYRRALAFDPSDAQVFHALESLLRREDAYPELLELYREAADRADDPTVRKGYQFKIATIDEESLGDLPRAIEDYRAILDTDPADAEAVLRLDALLVKTEAWRDLSDLLERRITDAIDSEERAALRFRLGRLRADRLEDPRGAVDAFREILDEKRDHRVAINALEKLADQNPELRLGIVEILEPIYRELDDWARLIVVLNVRLGASTDVIERGQLLREIARLKESRAKDIPGAFAAYSQAFAADAGDGEARESIERLAAEHGLWDDLVASYEAAVAASDDVQTRTDLLRAIATTHDQKRGDPRAAIVAFNRLFDIDDSQLDVLDQLSELHVMLSDWEGHVEVLERKVERTLDDDDRRRHLHAIGELQRDMLNRPEKSIHAYQRVLDLDPTDVNALEALDGLFTQLGDHRALSQVLTQRLDIEADPEVRRDTALRLGRLWEVELKDPQKAIDAYRRVLDDAPTHRDAILALERLYIAQGLHNDLLENLRTQIALAADDAARTPLRLREGALLARELTDPDAALEAYREVLTVDPNNAEAIRAVRALADRADQRVAAVEILEPIFRNASRWDDLVATLELKLTGIDDPPQRLTELRGLASVHEDGRRDLTQAFETMRRAFHEDPSDSLTLAEMERLAGALDRWADVVSVLELESQNAMDPSVGRDLSMHAASVAEQRLHDDVRATASYRRALEQGGDDQAVLAPLDRIYTRNGQWRELSEVLERRVAIAEVDDLDTLEVRVAELREGVFGDPQGALASFRNVVERTPSHAQALAGLERLIQIPSVRADALDVLEQCYQRNDDSARMAWLLALRVQASDLASDRVRLLGELARLREERLQDASGAFDAMVEAFKVDPGDEQVVSEIERLAPTANAWDRLRGVTESVLRAHPELNPQEVCLLNYRAAQWYLEHLSDPTAAEARLQAALAAEPESLDALVMLEGLLRTAGRERDLVATLRRRSELELDVEARKQMLREAAGLAEHKLGDAATAADLTTLLLEADEADVEALDTLARLRQEQNRHGDVAELLARRARLTDDPAQAAALRRRVAELYVGPIGDTDRAVLAYREVLDFDPNDMTARAALESIFERAQRWKDLEDSLRSRLDVSVTAEERAETRLRLASLAETRFHSRRDAVEYLREVLDELPTHAAAGRELERLYTQEQRWNDLSELLERRVEDYVAAGDAAGELTTLVRIGELHERELRQPSRAIELYERVLDRDPNHVGALRAIARLAETEGDWQRTADMLSRAVSLSTPGRDGAELALYLARVQSERLSLTDDAERTLFRALELDPTSQDAIERLKAAATRRNDPAMLADVTEREVAILTDPKQKVTSLKSLADLSRNQLQDPNRAIRYLEQARELAGDDREVLLPLVDLYGAVGREADALPIIEKIISSFGNRRTKELAQWQHRLGQAYERMGNVAQALAMYDAAFKIDLTSVPILRDLGLLCLRTGDLERAQKTFRALLLQRLDGAAGITKADVYFYLGDTLSQQGDKPKAIGMLERALEAEKGHPRASELLARLKAG